MIFRPLFWSSVICFELGFAIGQKPEQSGRFRLEALPLVWIINFIWLIKFVMIKSKGGFSFLSLQCKTFWLNNFDLGAEIIETRRSIKEALK